MTPGQKLRWHQREDFISSRTTSRIGNLVEEVRRARLVPVNSGHRIWSMNPRGAHWL